uniref:Uncharacterized protein n=1 Tax=Chromera velia CCMP2878 TaxID=1169474 RepID=A0A0G4FUR3_9ALVE|mmetsp:Transcript_33583/g.66543  ORF Transcript_33583/g.66543 Transcript_33583/m.66543 type:complete len:223 (-) Transcript_33583:476-1144(-)|eukprot:Cvel_18807.t1-p1 / transcript=Cvel_18807.t1 / gene=Cvel_18807 / organism=Chromera_velia_CCMP2878 / gene_product=hypothetical protein / transcript_product=hypothetical protein / location=Cvel_scaffold1579:28831-30872(-) / protein_length=222 / sequence_SO=supercontig / SO=protein_coding / is_pseudo=false
MTTKVAFIGLLVSLCVITVQSFIGFLLRPSVFRRAMATSPPSSALCMEQAAVSGPVMGTESIMSKKDHGTCTRPVSENLRWGVDVKTADRICCFNRHYAEYSSYFWRKTKFVEYCQENASKGPVKFFDPVSQKLLFTAPIGRTMDQFIAESKSHGWPSFRDAEVNWDQVRVLPDGETVSLAGTHLGHNLPDSKGNRYCINLVSVAGTGETEGESSNVQASEE